MRIESLSDLEQLRKSYLSGADQATTTVTICAGTGCRACGAEDVIEAFHAETARQGLGSAVKVKASGCHGFCERGALVVLYPEGILYQRVKPTDVPEILSRTVVEKQIIERLLYVDPATGEKIVYEKDIPFYKKQKRVLLGMNQAMDPADIDDYIALGGYTAAAKALTEMTPEEVVEEVKRSGLRGRGGGGFPTGAKWEQCRNAPGDCRYVICNADEGDPGAYMDRSLLEGNPHSVLEGMIIGAYAMGANEGYIYVRNEYPLAVENARKGDCPGQRAGLDRGRHLFIRFRVRCEDRERRRGLYLRRVERAHGIPGRQTGPPEGEVRSHRGKRLMGEAHRPQQRGNVGEHTADHPRGLRTVSGDRDGRQQGDEDILTRRQDQQHRSRRGPHGHVAPGDHL